MASVDYLKDCISDPALIGQHKTVPLDEFSKAYCLRCLRADCSRAAGQNSALQQRLATWRKDLFDAPPRAAETDPAYDAIRAKRFLSSAQRPAEMQSPSKSTLITPTLITPTLITPTPQQELGSVIQTQDPRPTPSLANTPFTQGMVLPQGEVVLEPGSSYTFGDSK